MIPRLTWTFNLAITSSIPPPPPPPSLELSPVTRDMQFPSQYRTSNTFNTNIHLVIANTPSSLILGALRVYLMRGRPVIQEYAFFCLVWHWPRALSHTRRMSGRLRQLRYAQQNKANMLSPQTCNLRPRSWEICFPY